MGAVERGATRARYVPPVWSIINAPTSFSAQAWPFGRASTRTSSTLGRRPDTAQPIIGTNSATISTSGRDESAAANGLAGPARGRSSPSVLGDDRQQGGPVLVDLGRPEPAHPGQLGDRARPDLGDAGEGRIDQHRERRAVGLASHPGTPLPQRLEELGVMVAGERDGRPPAARRPAPCGCVAVGPDALQEARAAPPGPTAGGAGARTAQLQV